MGFRAWLFMKLYIYIYIYIQGRLRWWGLGPTTFEALFKNSMLENNGDCGFQLSTKAIVTNIQWLINCD